MSAIFNSLFLVGQGFCCRRYISLIVVRVGRTVSRFVTALARDKPIIVGLDDTFERR